MFPKNTSDVEYPDEEKYKGTRLDNRNLVQEWEDAKPKDKVRGQPASSAKRFLITMDVGLGREEAACPGRILVRIPPGHQIHP